MALVEQIKSGLAGQAVPEGTAPAKSTVAADVAGQQVASQKKDLLAQAQANQQEQKQKAVAIATADQLSQDQVKQRENTMLQTVNRQINDIHMKLQSGQLDMANEEQMAQVEQLSFLNNLSNRKWADTVKMEGTKRRLDVESQMKEALLYANFDDMVSMLNNDLSFKSKLYADERSFQEFLSTINPESALQAAIQMQKDENATRSIQAAVGGVTEAAGQWAKSYTSSKPAVETEQPSLTPAPVAPAAPSVAAPKGYRQ
jgi:hypothetical protein